jgi:hypothetical protein
MTSIHNDTIGTLAAMSIFLGNLANQTHDQHAYIKPHSELIFHLRIHTKNSHTATATLEIKLQPEPQRTNIVS